MAKKKVQPPAVPKDVRPSVVKKFRTKDRSKRLLVVRLPHDSGYVIHAVSKKSGLAPVRTFPVPPTSEIPVPVHMSVCRELAIWYARHVAKHGTAPTLRRERGRRRRYTKQALAVFTKHLATKAIVSKIGDTRPPKIWSPQKLVFPFICMYDPKARRKDPVFVLHKATCGKLDHARKRTHKHGGTSWVIEAKTATQARDMQLAEFIADDKGYDVDDFAIHSCKGDE